MHMHMIDKITVIVYPRYYPFSAELTLSRGIYSTMLVPQPLHIVSYVTLGGTTESDLGWSTPLMTSVL